MSPAPLPLLPRTPRVSEKAQSPGTPVPWGRARHARGESIPWAERICRADLRVEGYLYCAPPGRWGDAMQQHQGVGPALRILRHDLTLLALVVALLAISVGVLAAARHEPSAIAAGPPLPAAVPEQIETQAAGADPPPEIEPVAEEPQAPRLQITRGELAAGENLASSLGRQGITPDVVGVISRELAPLFDFRRAQPGHRYRLTRDAEGALVAFRYQTSADEVYGLRRDGDGWTAAREQAELRPQVARIAGLVVSNLHDAVVALGERGSSPTTLRRSSPGTSTSRAASGPATSSRSSTSGSTAATRTRARSTSVPAAFWRRATRGDGRVQRRLLRAGGGPRRLLPARRELRSSGSSCWRRSDSAGSARVFPPGASTRFSRSRGRTTASTTWRPRAARCGRWATAG